MRYVVPQFDGQDAVDKLGMQIEQTLLSHGAILIRFNEYLGVFTFGLPPIDTTTNHGINLSNANWVKLANALTVLHPNCIAWSYSKLNKASTDRRTLKGM